MISQLQLGYISVLNSFTMGATTSNTVDLLYTSDKRDLALKNLDHRLELLRQEVVCRPQAIKNGVLNTIYSVTDAVILRYSELDNIRIIEKSVEKIFQKFPGREHVIDATRAMISDMRSSESSSLRGWQHRQRFKDHDGKRIGLEIHYKTQMFDDVPTSHTRDTVVLIAYKCLAHTMDKHTYEVDELSESMMSMNIRDLSLKVSSFSCTSSTKPVVRQLTSAMDESEDLDGTVRNSDEDSDDECFGHSLVQIQFGSTLSQQHNPSSFQSILGSSSAAFGLFAGYPGNLHIVQNTKIFSGHDDTSHQ